MMNAKIPNAIVLIASCTCTTWASAHIGTEPGAHSTLGLWDGLLHPLTGLDHLAAMLAVGFWSALTARRVWTAPLAFAAMLLLGALLGLTGIELPAVEPLIAASLLVLGLLVALRTRLHVAGLGLGLALRRQNPWLPRMAGAAVTLLGGTLLLQMI